MIFKLTIAKGTIFSILGSDKSLSQPMNGIYMCGQTIVETSTYTAVRRVQYSKKSKVCILPEQ